MHIQAHEQRRAYGDKIGTVLDRHAGSKAVGNHPNDRLFKVVDQVQRRLGKLKIALREEL